MKQIQLLLTESVDNLGIVGDVVKVRPGYARNFLLPRNMATEPTPGNVKRLAARRAEVEAEMKQRRSALEAVLEKLKTHEITMMRSANEQGVLFGGVSQHDIAEALRAEGFPVDDRMVRIGEQIKRLDSYQVPVVLASDLKAEIKLWVVSDKPSDQLGEAEAPAEEAVEEKREKPSRSKRKREEESAEAKEGGKEGKEAKAAKAAAPEAEGEAKPKGKKGKKAAEAE